MKVLVALLLLCSTANAGRHRCHAKCQASLQKQLNRKWENENGITARKWDVRFNRSWAFLNITKKLSPWGWITP